MNNTSNTTNERPRVAVTFAAIDTYVEKHMISPVETKGTGDRYKWGDLDKYPGYLLDLYDNVATLRSIIDGSVDFIAGDDVLFGGERDKVLNRWGETAPEIVRQLARNVNLFGGFAIEVIRSNEGGIAELYSIDLQYLRTNKENTVFWYSEKWDKGGRDAEEVPAFMPGAGTTPRSILFVKMDQMHIYPTPPYAAALKACEIERCIDDFHLNNLDNGFTSPAIISFNNGIPEDEEKNEITRGITEKYTGHQNAGRPVVSFADTKENAVTIESLKTEDFGDRYQALAKRSQQAIFTAFRCSPIIFGIVAESSLIGAEQNYEDAYKLYNRTQVRPRQRKIADAFARIYGAPVLQITPFSLDGASEAVVN